MKGTSLLDQLCCKVHIFGAVVLKDVPAINITAVAGIVASGNANDVPDDMFEASPS